jgi:hypothetical protein
MGGGLCYDRGVRRRWYVIWGAVLLAGLWAAIRFWPVTEPSYEGRSLKQWLDGRITGHVSRDEFANVIEHMGTNAVPYLLEYIQQEESSLKLEGYHFLRRAFPNSAITQRYYWWLGRQERQRRAAEAFEVFGSRAEFAVPILDKCLDRLGCADSAATALIHIGDKGLPHVFAALTNRPPLCAAVITIALSNYGSNAAPAIPAMIRNLQSTNASLARLSASTIGRISLQPELVIPALQNTLKDPRADVRLGAIVGLSHFGDSARSALSQALNDSNPTNRLAATNYLKNQFGESKMSM